MSGDLEDQKYVNSLAAQRSANFEEINRLRDRMRRVSGGEAEVIRAKIFSLDEKSMRLKKLLDHAKQEGLSPEELAPKETYQSSLVRRIFGKRK